MEKEPGSAAAARGWVGATRAGLTKLLAAAGLAGAAAAVARSWAGAVGMAGRPGSSDCVPMAAGMTMAAVVVAAVSKLVPQ